MEAFVSVICSWCDRWFGVTAPLEMGKVQAEIGHVDPLASGGFLMKDGEPVVKEGRLVKTDTKYLCKECNEVCDGLEEDAMAAYFSVYEVAAQRQRAKYRLQRDVIMRENWRKAVQGQ
jgi:hypothetical protein